jgi:integrase
MKSTSKKRTPSIVNLTVKRRYLTQREIDRLMDCARKHGRYGHRDATMILVAYRHGLRASEVCDLCDGSRSSYFNRLFADAKPTTAPLASSAITEDQVRSSTLMCAPSLFVEQSADATMAP